MLRGLRGAALVLAPSDRPPSYYLALGRLVGAAAALGARGAPPLPSPLSAALVKALVDAPLAADDVAAARRRRGWVRFPAPTAPPSQVDPSFYEHRLRAVVAPSVETKMFPGDGQTMVSFEHIRQEKSTEPRDLA